VDTFSVINDLDGSFGAGPNMTLMPRSRFTDAMDCKAGNLTASTHGVLCPARVVRTRAEDLVVQTGDVHMFVSRDGMDVVRQAFAGVNGDPGNARYLQFVSVPNQDYHFGVEFASNPGVDFYLQIRDAWPGDVIRYELRNVDPNTRVVSGDIGQVASLNDMINSPGSAWYKAGTTLHFKVVMSSAGQRWGVSRLVQFGR
jgi:hypothetical protein